MSTKLSNRESEILQVIEVVAREQGLEPDAVITALEQALVKPALSKYGTRNDISVRINRDTGAISFYRNMAVVAEVSNPDQEIQYEEAIALYPARSIEIGQSISEELPAIDFDRIAAAASRQVVADVLQNTRRSQHYNEYKNRVGEMFTVTVKRDEISFYLAEFDNKVEGIFFKEDLLPREKLKVGERIKAVIRSLRPDSNGPVVRLSRTAPELLHALMYEKITEVNEGIIDVKSVARDPGSHAKVAVYSADPGVDAVGACIGPKGSRIKMVSEELMGEKIDVIEWSGDSATYIINALSPAQIAKVIMDEEAHSIEVITPQDQLSLAIGRRGQNVKLASALTGWRITLLTEEKETERSNKILDEAIQLFCDSLNIDELMARFLATEGFYTIEDIAACDPQDLIDLDLDSAIATELHNRAVQFLAQQENQLLEELNKTTIQDDLRADTRFSLEQKYKLTQNGCNSLLDVADLSSDELREILADDQIDPEVINALILELRTQCYPSKGNE